MWIEQSSVLLVMCNVRHVAAYTENSLLTPNFIKKTVSKIKDVQLKLSALCPFLDSHGILRVCGRLSKIDINYDREQQILLPQKECIRLFC